MHYHPQNFTSGGIKYICFSIKGRVFEEVGHRIFTVRKNWNSYLIRRCLRKDISIEFCKKMANLSKQLQQIFFVDNLWLWIICIGSFFEFSTVFLFANQNILGGSTVYLCCWFNSASKNYLNLEIKLKIGFTHWSTHKYNIQTWFRKLVFSITLELKSHTYGNGRASLKY